MTAPTATPNSQPRRSRRVGEDRLLSLPNVVTTSRLVLVPVFVGLYVGRAMDRLLRRREEIVGDGLRGSGYCPVIRCRSST